MTEFEWHERDKRRKMRELLEDGSNGGDSESDGDEFGLFSNMFDDPDREDTFWVNLSTLGKERELKFNVVGVKAELGQTLTSTGLTVWRASEKLSAFLFASPERVRHRRVCELGAGLGLISILVAKLQTTSSSSSSSSSFVLATDGCPDTIKMLKDNIALNGMGLDMGTGKEEGECGEEGIKQRQQVAAGIEAKELWWGEGMEEARDLASFDCILAADVIYVKQAIEPLLKSMVALLKKTKEAEVILSFARRNVPVHLFLEKAVEYGFAYSLAKRWDISEDRDSVGVVISGDDIVQIDDLLGAADGDGEGRGGSVNSDEAMEPIYSLRWSETSLSLF